MKVSIVLLLGILTYTSQAQVRPAATTTATSARLAEIAQFYTPHDAFMGTVLVAKGSELLLNRAYGKASLEWGIPNTVDVRFRIGSLTKQFTAALVLLTQEAGQLAVTDPVTKYLPNAPASWAHVTLADLLHHTSGIPDFIFDPRFLEWGMGTHTPAEVMAFIQQKPLNFAPGTQFGYSNSNYTLLGLVLEKASGRRYVDLLRERILLPLGMKNSGLDSDELILSKRATGYQPGPQHLLPSRSSSLSVAWAVGGIYSTTADLWRWEQGLFMGKVLSASSLQAMTTPGKSHYGDGVFINERQGVTVVEHGGQIEGFTSYMSYVPSQQVAVIVLGNVSGDTPDRLAGQLLDVTLGKAVILTPPRTAQAITPAELTRFSGTYVISPQLTLAITPAADGLLVLATGQPPLSFSYEGTVNGHPQFFTRSMDAQLEFAPSATGTVPTVLLHLSGSTMPGQRQELAH